MSDVIFWYMRPFLASYFAVLRVEGVVASFQYFNADWEYYRGVFRVCLVPGLRYVVCAVLRYLDVFLLEVQQVYVGEAG